MGTEQQFCLRWNNHQSTLVAVFDTLLESGTLVDCTLAAEGQYLKAHKVVLSACSPYFELLLSQHYEKHPIVILKDVKFQELKAMMDYMYRGEVNISQDQLGALLKAAESLQIKGLSDSGGGGTTDKDSSDKRHERRREAPPPPPTPILPHSSGLTIEQRRPVQPAPPPVVELPEDSPPLRVPGSREGSLSPVPRKRKRHRRRSSGDDSAQILSMTESRETSSSCELPPQSQPSAPSISTPILPVVPTPSLKSAAEQQVALGQEEQTETEILPRPLTTTQANISSPQTVSQDPEPAPTPKVEPPSELLEPKSEYLEEQNEDSVEDLTLDDDMDEMDQAKPGPSHGGEGSSSQGGFAPWHVAADRSTDEVFMAAQEAVGAHRDSQGMCDMQHQQTNQRSTQLKFLSLDSNLKEEKDSDSLTNNLQDSSLVFGDLASRVPAFPMPRIVDTTQRILGCVLSNNLAVNENLLIECRPTVVDTFPSDGKIFACEKCGKSFKYGRYLSTHKKYECEMNPQYQRPACTRCSKTFRQFRNLQRHQKYECGQQPGNQCPLCPFKTKYKHNLKKHIMSIHHCDPSASENLINLGYSGKLQPLS